MEMIRFMAPIENRDNAVEFYICKEDAEAVKKLEASYEKVGLAAFNEAVDKLEPVALAYYLVRRYGYLSHVAYNKITSDVTTTLVTCCMNKIAFVDTSNKYFHKLLCNASVDEYHNHLQSIAGNEVNND